MKTKFFIYLFLFGIVGCMPSKRYVYLPPEHFKADKELLKTNGYYYTEKTTKYHCEYLFKEGRKIKSDSTLYNRKHLRLLFLYDNGLSYHSGGEMLAGLFLDTNYKDDSHCDKLTNWNTYEKAHQYAQMKLKNGSWDNHHKAHKGTYKIENDSQITVQVYLTGLNYNYILAELKGSIKNDSTIYFSSYHEYHPKYSKELNETYHFKQFDKKPDSTSYILENRKKFGKK